MVLNLARCVLQALRTDMAQEFQFLVGVKKSGGSRGWNNELSEMRKTMVPVVTISGRTDLQCISCDDPAVKWAQSPLTAPDKPIVAERV